KQPAIAAGHFLQGCGRRTSEQLCHQGVNAPILVLFGGEVLSQLAGWLGKLLLVQGGISMPRTQDGMKLFLAVLQQATPALQDGLVEPILPPILGWRSVGVLGLGCQQVTAGEATVGPEKPAALLIDLLGITALARVQLPGI